MKSMTTIKIRNITLINNSKTVIFMAQFKLDQRVEISENVGAPLMQINIHNNLQTVTCKLPKN